MKKTPTKIGFKKSKKKILNIVESVFIILTNKKEYEMPTNMPNGMDKILNIQHRVHILHSL